MKKYIINIIKYLIVGIFTLYFLSCSDFLDLNPLDQISSEVFWQNEKQVDMALSGVYASLYSGYFNYGMADFDIMAGDYNESGFSGLKLLAQGQIEPTSGSLVSGIYSSTYRSISGCNFFLDNVDQAPLDEEVINEYKAEVLFLRSLFYFTLTQHYGGVPLYLKQVTIDEALVKQSSKATVIAQVLSDLDFAIAHLPNISYDGHAVKASALALKARVLLFEEQWEEAATTANQIITDGIFSLYDNFRDLFLKRGQIGNPEIIFSTRYQEPDCYSELDIGWQMVGSINPRQELVDAYECTDGLPITSSPLYDPTNWKLNRDPRLVLTIKNYEDSAYTSDGRAIAYAYLHTSTSGYSPVKYCDWDKMPCDYNTLSNQDWILLRYADVLLMYAEAKNEASGPDASVYQAINEVRARPGVDMPPIPEGLTKEEMRTLIRHERRVEFASEGLRWGDIKRWRTAEDYIPTLVDEGGTQRQFDPTKHYLLPFPQSEMDINDKLEQNPGY